MNINNDLFVIWLVLIDMKGIFSEFALGYWLLAEWLCGCTGVPAQAWRLVNFLSRQKTSHPKKAPRAVAETPKDFAFRRDSNAPRDAASGDLNQGDFFAAADPAYAWEDDLDRVVVLIRGH